MTGMLDTYRLVMSPALAGAIMSETLGRPITAHALPGNIAHLGVESGAGPRHYLLPVDGATRSERDALDAVCVRRVHTHAAGEAFLIPDPDTLRAPHRAIPHPRSPVLDGLLAHLRHAAGAPRAAEAAAGG